MLNPDVDTLTPTALTFSKIAQADRAAAIRILEKADAAQETFLASRRAVREDGSGLAAGARNFLRDCYNFAVQAFCWKPYFENLNNRFAGPDARETRVMAANAYVVAAMRDHLSAHPALVEKACLTRGDLDCLQEALSTGASPRLSMQ